MAQTQGRRPNLQAKTWHWSTREPGKVWTVERIDSYGVPNFRVRCYDRGVMISEVPAAMERTARAEFERRVEVHYR